MRPKIKCLCIIFAFKLKDTMHNASNAKEHKLHISKINFLYMKYYK